MISQQIAAFFLFSTLLSISAFPLPTSDDVKLFVNKIFDTSKNQNINQSFTVRKENDTIILEAVDIVNDADKVKVITKRTDEMQVASDSKERKAELSFDGGNNSSLNIQVVGGREHQITAGNGTLLIKSSGGW